MNRRLNRGLFKMALENEVLPEGETRPDATVDAPAADAPAVDTPAVDAAVVSAAEPAADKVTTTSTDTVEIAVATDATTGDVTKVVVEVKPTDAPAEVVEEVVVPPVAETPAADAPAADAVVDAAVDESVRDPADVPAADVVEGDVVDEGAVADEDLVVIETDGDEVADQMADAEVVEIDSTELLQEVDDAERAATTLESIAELLHVSAQNGGLNQDGARLLKIATEHIYAETGLGLPLGIPAMESFNMPGARAGATSIALEDIQEQVKKVWEAIVAGVKKAVEWLAEFANKVLTANGRMKSRAQALANAAEKMSGQPKAKSVGGAKLVQALAVGNRLPSNLAAELVKLNTFAAAAIGDKTVMGMRDTVRALNDLATSEGADGSALVKVIEGLAGVGLKAGTAAGVAEAPAGTTLFVSPTFVGNSVIWAYMPTSVEGVGSFRTGVQSTPAEVADSAEAPTLNASDVKAIAAAAMAYVDASDKYKDVQKAVKDLSDFMAKTLTSTAASRMSADEGMKGKVKALTAGLKAGRALIKGIHQPAFSLAARANSIALDYAAASVAAYTGKTAVAVPAAA